MKKIPQIIWQLSVCRKFFTTKRKSNRKCKKKISLNNQNPIQKSYLGSNLNGNMCNNLNSNGLFKRFASQLTIMISNSFNQTQFKVNSLTIIELF